MDDVNPFSQGNLSRIFDISLKDAARLNSRESSTEVGWI